MEATKDPIKDPVVMLVDDDDALADILSHRFQAEEIPFVYAPDGETAVEFLKNGVRPKLILLDISMPGMDGFEVLKIIKGTPGLADIPVIITSNFGQQKDIEWGKKLGAKQFIEKVNMVPADLVDLVRQETGVK